MAEQTKLTIEITAGHCLGGVGNDVYPGQVLVAPRDLSIADAWKKIRMGYARILPNAPEPGSGPPQEAPGPAPVTHGDPVIASRDPEIKAQAAPPAESLTDAASPQAQRGRIRSGGR